MILRRVKIELEYDDKIITCDHHPNDEVEPTLIIVNGYEYEGHLSVEVDKDTYIVRFTRT